MKPSLIVKPGDVFGKLTVLAVVRKPGSSIQFCKCLCACGNDHTVSKYTLFSGDSTSCGCRHLEIVSRHGHAGNGSRTVEHSAWTDMKQRCLNSKHRSYHNYGGRGITVCPRWMKFENFLADMKLRPGKGYSIERINNAKGYSKSNCYWASWTAQARNKRSNRLITIGKETHSVTVWAELKRIKRETIYHRLAAGFTGREAVEVPHLPRWAGHLALLRYRQEHPEPAT